MLKLVTVENLSPAVVVCGYAWLRQLSRGGGSDGSHSSLTLYGTESQCRKQVGRGIQVGEKRVIKGICVYIKTLLLIQIGLFFKLDSNALLRSAAFAMLLCPVR